MIYPKVLMRNSLAEDNERKVAEKYFTVIDLRSQAAAGDLIIPRYSCLPYYRELEQDLQNEGARLIQSYKQHKYIADFEYYRDVKKFTFKSWSMDEIQYAPEEIRYVVKGCTNSRKFSWNSHMFARNRRRAMEIAAELSCDSIIGSQRIIFREYIPLLPLELLCNGLQACAEWRFFYFKNNILADGFYWSIIEDEHKIDMPKYVKDFANDVASIVNKKINFFVLDIGLKEDESPILIEINDGCMSGLSDVNADELYSNLLKVL